MVGQKERYPDSRKGSGSMAERGARCIERSGAAGQPVSVNSSMMTSATANT